MCPSSCPDGHAPERRTFVVAYDVADDRRRDRVAHALLDFGVRVQYSVFECSLTRAERRDLLVRLRGRIDLAEDVVSIYPLCRRCAPRVRRIGRPPPEPDPQYWFL